MVSAMNGIPLPEPPPQGRLLVLSPHLDDAAFGCGRLLASAPGATVATVFAGRPVPGHPLTAWDRACGFSAGDDVIGRRREEDRAAQEILGARPRWLDLKDSQYGGEAPETVAATLRDLLAGERPAAVLFPLGLFHSDHKLVHRAALALLGDFPAIRWLAYEDGLYRRLDGLGEEAVAGLRRRGLRPRPVRFAETPAAARLKQAAAACYRSQFQGLATPGRLGQAGLDEPETCWELQPPEPP